MKLKRSTERNRVLELANLIAWLAATTVNIAAEAIPLNGITTAQISDSLPNLFVPAGLTFSIWGVIYILTGLFAVYQFRGYATGLVRKISYWFVIGSAANLAWIILWHYLEIPASLIAMLVLFLSLMVIYLRLGPYTSVSRENVVMRVPFSVYLGWITVATIANVTAVLVYFHWDAFGIPEATWAILVIAIATLITLAVLFTRKDIAYSLVVDWALLGIMLKQINNELSVAATSAIGMILILMAIILVWYKSWRSQSRKKK
jgi:hypothetical protein